MLEDLVLADPADALAAFETSLGGGSHPAAGVVSAALPRVAP